RMIAADGSVVWLHDIVNVDVEDGEAKMLYGVMIDITRSKNAEMAMAASEARFRALFEQSPFGIAIRDADDRVTNVNPALCRMLGFERSELLVAGVEGLAHPDDVATSDDTVERLRAPDSAAQHFERRYRRQDGSWARGRTTRSVVRDDQGRPLFRVGIIEDITDQKRTWEERRRLATAIEHAGEAVVVTDVHGVIEYVNPAFETITGFAKADAVGRQPSLLKSGVHDDAFYGGLWKQITGGGTWSGGLVNRRKDGSLYEAETTISPIFRESGEVTGFVAVQRDISEKLALLDKLRRAEDLQSFGRLVSGVAHEVRNPLAAIQAALGAIEIDLGTDEAHVPFFEIIRTQVERLTRLMRDLLDLAKPLQQSRIAIQAVDEICASSIAMWRHAKPEEPLSRIQFRSTTDAAVRMDPARMQQVIVNLLDNAVQHSPKDSVVTVLVDEVGDWCRISVRDAGAGLTPPAIDRIFEPFFTTRRGGTGLGLPLVRNIVEQLGGRVSLVNNEPPPGATAEIVLPLVREAVGSSA
ncbi:MAG: PAS domain S-box protein, partial [Thermoanaerobaculia bacterium]